MEQQASLEQPQESNPSSRSSEDPSGNYNPETNDDSDFPIAVRKGVRSCTKHPIYTFVSYEGLSPKFKTFVANLDNIQVPNNIKEALCSPEWKSIVYEEIHALEKNGTWEISKLPAGKRLVGCKWIFTIKYNEDGSVNRFKARLVAKGFTQS